MKKLLFIVLLLIIPSALSARVLLPMEDPVNSLGLSDNIVYDIITHQGVVWMATGHGVSYKNIDSTEWSLYDESNGLIAHNVSAIYSSGDAVWIAMNHYDSEKDAYYSDGLAFTYDQGETWEFLNDTLIDDSVIIKNTIGYERIMFDISGVDDSIIFVTSKVGGLMASFDKGVDWKSIYFSRSDSINSVNLGPNDEPPFSNRYFSVAADTLHTDSMIVWAGTPLGLRRFVYAPSYGKPSANFIFDVTSVDSFVYVAGDSGLTRIEFDSLSNGYYVPSYHSSFVSDGLPGMSVTTAYGFGDRLFVGTVDSVWRDIADNSLFVIGDGSGMAISDDDGISFHTTYAGLDDLVGENKYGKQFTSVGDNLFLAGYEAGLFVSSDTGQNWIRVELDTLDGSLSNPRNFAHSLAVDSMNLWIGTDSGLVLIRFDDTGTDTLHQYFVFEDGNNSGARAYKVAVQNYRDTTTGDVDSIAIWTINHPVDTSIGEFSVYYSMDYGGLWEETRPYQSPQEIPYYDIAFIDPVVLLSGVDIYSYSNNKSQWTKLDGSTIRETIGDQIFSFNNLKLKSILTVGDTIYIGSEHGFAYSPPPEGTATIWHLIFSNKDPQHFDKVSNYVYPHLTGNFVNVLGVQPLPGGNSRIWASTRPAFGTAEYIGVASSTLDGLDWRQYPGLECWNFAFNGETVFGASTGGLVYSSDIGSTWDTVHIKGTQISSIPEVDYEIDPEIPIISVEVVGDTLWAGTEGGGAAKIALVKLGLDEWQIYRVYAAPNTFAYPLPFSHAEPSHTDITFNYEVKHSTSVTIEVYDFAMDLVKMVIENEPRGAGVYNTDQWDGLNGRGDQVAVGMYYFKVSFSNGEAQWGKIAIIP